MPMAESVPNVAILGGADVADFAGVEAFVVAENFSDVGDFAAVLGG